MELEDRQVFSCHAKGLFRKDGEKPLVGDMVEMEITHDKDMEGHIINILPRSSFLERPPVANVDRVLIIQSLDNPKPRLSLTDKYLIMAENRGITPIIGFNKLDLCRSEIDRYRESGYSL